jgi:hypothetical protein
VRRINTLGIVTAMANQLTGFKRAMVHFKAHTMRAKCFTPPPSLSNAPVSFRVKSARPRPTCVRTVAFNKAPKAFF